MRAVFMLAAGALIAACAHDRDNRASSTTTTGASFDLSGTGGSRGGEPWSPRHEPELADQHHPANRLGRALCERKLVCAEIGPGKGKPFGSMHACLTEAREKAHHALDGLACEGGLDDRRFDECLFAARAAACGPSVDVVAKLDACKRERVCAR